MLPQTYPICSKLYTYLTANYFTISNQQALTDNQMENVII